MKEINACRIKKFLIGSVIFTLIACGCGLLRSTLHHDYQIDERYSADDRDYVVLIHGLYSYAEALAPIAATLEGDYNVVIVQYPTTQDDIEAITEKYLKQALANINTDRKIHFVAHSMGSVVLRHYLNNNTLPQLGKVIFLSPPSHGSGLADFFLAKLMPDTFGKAVLQLSMASGSFVNQLGEPAYPCQVLMSNRSYNPVFSAIIDGKDDGMVPVESSRLNACGWTLIDKSTHRSILDDKRAHSAIVQYLGDSIE